MTESKFVNKLMVNFLEEFKLKEVLCQAMPRKWKFYSLLLLCTLILSTKYCTAKDTLTQFRQLYVNQSLVSAGEIFELGFFSPDNSKNLYIGLWYKIIPVRRISWVANRENPLAANDSASTLKIGSDGNLILLDGEKNTVWSTNVSIQPNSNTTAVLTDKGELILKDTNSGGLLWNSFNYPIDTILSGMSVGYDIGAGAKQELSSWKSEDDPSPGKFKVGISQETPPQAFTWINNSEPYWRSGPWNGGKFTGIPDEDSGYSNGMNLVQDNHQQKAYFSFNTFNRSYVAILAINPSGSFQFNIWDAEKNAWDLNWQAQHHLCDVYGTCGPFSVCNKTKTPFCECLRGFIPRSSQEWSEGNWTSGCVRQAELLCEQNRSSMASKESKNDTFLKLTQMKLPDRYLYLFDLDYAGCREWCLTNCSCVAYAYPQGIDCMVWTSGLIDVQQFSYAGEDLYLRLANSEFGEHKRKTILIAVFTTVASAILLGILMHMIYRWRTNKKGGRRIRVRDIIMLGKAQIESDITGEEMKESQELPSKSSELPMISVDELSAATNDFSDENKLGAGGFGAVYKGILGNGQEIAVKRLSSHSGQGVEEFKNEILLISKLQHRNLVRLLGCSIHSEEKLLVYEHMENKSLDNFLFDRTKKAQLGWEKRFKIIQGIARGLVYLHRDSCLRIIHRDLKASNILLDKDMNPKISDFGLARAFRVTEELANTHRVVGTFGYMSPEYVMRGLFSEKSDVYSFGVLLLEIVSGVRNCGFHNLEEHLSLLSYAWQLWSENREVDLIDELISKSCSLTEALRCTRIGLLCVQDHASDRPTMSNVVLMLSGETEIPRPKQPTFTIQSLLDSDSKLHRSIAHSRNEITVSLTDGRCLVCKCT